MVVPHPLRATLAGLAGGVAWRLGLQWVFGPAQALLADPALQSAKMLAAFSLTPPAPRMYERPWIVWAALLAIGVLWGWVYASIAGRLWAGTAWVERGLRFAALAWLLLVPWFEFYLPWNVLREPTPLVALELACWAGVMILVGLAIAGVDALLAPRAPAATQGASGT